MASTRSYDFIVGPETSTAPTAGTPTTDNDTLSKGYADDTYAKLIYWGDAVADTTALKAVAAADRSDKQSRVKDDDKSIWVFDSSSSATEDGTTVIQPTTGTGRWLAASGSSGGSGGTASASELLQTQSQLASIGFGTRALDNSLRTNGLEVPAHTYFVGNLIENYTSGGSTAKVVWNPAVVFDSDKDYDSITGWAAVGAGTTLAATSGSTKVGSNHFSFNKDGSAVAASIRHTLAAQTLSVGANYRVYFWVDMPSVTGLSNIFLKIMGAATADFSKWDLTTNSAGSAITTGYNLMFVDIANTAASSTGGTAWTTSQLARYVEVGVTTSSAGQTYTGIKFAGLWFSHGDISAWAPKYLEFTVADTSNKNDIKIDSASTNQDGIVTLAATVAQNYTAGVAAAARALWYRSSLSWSQAGLIGFNTGLTSGTIALEEELRLTKVLRESLSGNYGAYVDMFTPQIYKVTSTGSGTILVADSENHSANLLNGDSVHIFKTVHSAGEPNFYLLATRAMTGNASHSSGTTTLTCVNTDVAAGDYIVKQHLSVSSSVVAVTANENFSAMNYDTTPNGAQLIGSKSYPLPNSVYAHWWLGGPSETLALKDQTGRNTLQLTKVGTPNFSDAFKAGKYAVSSLSAASYLRTQASSAQLVDGNGELIQISLWVNYSGVTDPTARAILTAYDETGASSDGWYCTVAAGVANVELNFPNAGSPTILTTSNALTTGWNHLVVQIENLVTQKVYLNGVLTSVVAGTIPATSTQAFYIGALSANTTVDAGMGNGATALKLAELIMWRGGNVLSQSDVNYLYNASIPQFFGYQPALLRNEYSATGQSGQRISFKAKLNRSTTAVSPYILDAGMIKTG